MSADRIEDRDHPAAERDGESARDSVLRRLGQRVRGRRKELGFTGQVLAERAALSRRFIAQIEAGQGNIALGRLEGLAEALSLPLEALVAEPRGGDVRGEIDHLLAGRGPEELRRALGLLELLLGGERPRVVALLGIRGAGKSAVGPRVAAALELPFLELDERIEAAAGLALAEIFTLHGEPYYRRLEGRCVAELLTGGEACVVALPGGVVSNDRAYELIRASCVCAWLKARPEDHIARVAAQGDRRPMTGSVDATAELRALIAAREPLYRQAELVVDTSKLTVEEVAAEVVRAAELRLAAV